MVAPVVVVDKVTDCEEEKRPGAGERTGVAAVAGGGVVLERTVIFRS
jgi:hypothetical protein